METRLQPRVRITYDREDGDAISIRELPFVIGVLGDFTGQPEEPLPRLRDRRFVHIFPDNLDSVMTAMRPHLSFSVENKLAEDPEAGNLRVDLRFRDMRDFLPENVARQVKPTKELLDLRQGLVDLRGGLNSGLSEAIRDVLLDREKLEEIQRELATEPPLHDGVVGRLVDEFGFRVSQWRDHTFDIIRAFLADFLSGAIALGRDVETMIDARLSQIDHLISQQVREIIHHPAFQLLEGTWRGLEQLVRHTRHSEELKIKILNATKKELLRDLQRAPEWDQTTIFKMVCRDEVWTFDGEPFAVLLGDYHFSAHPEDVEFLEKMAQVAADAHAPFLAAVDPHMFLLHSLTELGLPRSLERVFGSIDFAKWKSFRQSADARYVGLLLPRILLRPPYTNDRSLEDNFYFDEGVDGSDHSKYLWGNPIYAFGQCFARACEHSMWPAAACGSEAGPMQLATHRYVADEGDTLQKGPTEIAIDERRELELAALGFIPLCQRKGSNEAVIYEAPSCQRHSRYNDEGKEQEQAAWIATQLPAMFAASRFCHYILAIWRDRIGAWSGADSEAYFNRWLEQYVIQDDAASSEVRMKRPLREASVQIERVGPETIRVTISVRPHFRVPCPTMPVQVTISLPDPAWKATPV